MTDLAFFDGEPGVPPPATGRAAASAFFRLFSGPDGQTVLAYLRGRTVARGTLPDVATPNFTHLMCVREGENGLYRHIIRMIEQGRNEQ